MPPMMPTSCEQANTFLPNGAGLLWQLDTAGLRLKSWLEKNKAELLQRLADNGALLLRGLNILSGKQFGDLVTGLFDAPLSPYIYRSTPRTALKGKVYTATEYPADQTIAQHNENAYSKNIPQYIAFCCLLPATSGGRTPIGDTRQLTNVLTDKERAKFEDKGIMYVRNYSEIDLPWTEVFQTDSKTEVDTYCANNDIHCEWLDGDRLRTRQVNPAFVKHPKSGENLWLNQAHLFHLSSLPNAVQQSLVQSLGEENLPRNAYYGDGDPIEPELLRKIRQAHHDSRILFPWYSSDVLLLDNYYFTHGREPYTGARKVLTALV